MYIDLVINYHYEGFSAVQIQKKLTELFKEKIHALSFSSNLDDKEKLVPSQIDFHIVLKIPNHLKCFPNSSVRFISTHVNVPPTTVYRYLTEVLNYKCVHLRWIPHHLIDIWFFSTGDESWFCYEYFPSMEWIKDDDKAPDRVRRNLLARKIMIKNFWSKSGIHGLDVLDENLRMNSEYFITNALIPLKEGEAYLNSKNRKKKFTLHIDNSRVN